MSSPPTRSQLGDAKKLIGAAERAGYLRALTDVERLVRDDPRLSVPDRRKVLGEIEPLHSGDAWRASEYVGPEIARAGQRRYDDLVEHIFHLTQSAVPREHLLAAFLQQIDKLEKESPLLGAFVLESVGEGKSFAVQPTLAARIPRQILENLAEKQSTILRDSAFVRSVIVEHRPVELWHSQYIPDYDGALDRLTGQLARFHKQEDRLDNGYWVAAEPLPRGDAKNPNRALFMLYLSFGSAEQPAPPGGVAQERRCLHFLALAYQQLSDQLKGVAARVLAQRGELLHQLAPGILHHEIGTQMQEIDDVIGVQRVIAERLTEAPIGDKNYKRLLQQFEGSIGLLAESAKRLFGLADAFNNLEKRATDEAFVLHDILEQTHYLCYTRLGLAGLAMNWDEEAARRIKARSDPALLLHLLVNVVLNAANAFVSWPHRIPDAAKENRRLEIVPRILGEELRLDLVNNGPPIPTHIGERIFERGYTTRQGGHGQGLYICRLIAHYLGGRIELVNAPDLPNGMSVGFRVTMAREIGKHVDIESELPSYGDSLRKGTTA